MKGNGPDTVKEKLTEMKDVSELILDLAYSAILFNHKEIAMEVSRLEEKMDQLIYDIRVSVILGARNRNDAEKMSAILQIAEAAEKISNASGDIAKIVLEDIDLPPEFKEHLSKADEVVTKKEVKDGVGCGKSLGDLKLESETGLRVIAIRRGNEWIYDPDKHTVLEKGDVVFGRGSVEGIEDYHEIITGEVIDVDFMETGGGRSSRAGELAIEMKNISELATDLAYSAILFYNKEIADEVRELEEEMDQMNYDLDMWVLKASRKYSDDELSKLIGLLRLGRASEVVSDAAMEIADVVLRGVELHPVFALAVRESEEIITKVRVKESSGVVGKKIGDLSIKTETGMHIMAIRRGSGWIYSPGAETELNKNDLVIAKGTREGEDRLKEVLN